MFLRSYQLLITRREKAIPVGGLDTLKAVAVTQDNADWAKEAMLREYRSVILV